MCPPDDDERRIAPLPPGKPAETRRMTLGRIGERKVCRWLRQQGWEILATNLRCARGELDLVAFDGEVLVVGEVKTLRVRDGSGIAPFDSIGYRKRKLLRRTATAWLTGTPAKDGYGNPVARPVRMPALRFDAFAVTVHERTGEYKIEHVRGAL